MNKQHVLAILLLIALMSTVSICQAQTLSKPTVTIPSGWKLDQQTAYPNGPSEYDPAGGGMLAYVNQANDEVRVYYEKAPGTTFTSAALEQEAVSLFNRDFSDYTADDSGTVQAAGVPAGYARGYDATTDSYVFDSVFVKNNYFFNVMAVYSVNTQTEQQVSSIIDSISTGGAAILGGSSVFIIVGIIAAVVVVLVIVVMLSRRKKSAPQQTQMPQITPANYPPPPPPPPQ